MRFHDRNEAGQLLAEALSKYADRRDVLVLALPRGGVPVGFAVASALHAPMDVFIVRKLGVPGHEELAMGAIATGGIRVLDDEIIRSTGICTEVIDAVAAREQQELQRRMLAYGGQGAILNGKVIILVDDGIATGSTMRAAVAAVKQKEPARIVVAVPTAPPSTCDGLKAEADELVVVTKPERFYAVGQSYEVFDQTSDEEVRDLLERSKRDREDPKGKIHPS